MRNKQSLIQFNGRPFGKYSINNAIKSECYFEQKAFNIIQEVLRFNFIKCKNKEIINKKDH